MSRSRWGGFRIGKKIFSDWETRKSPSAILEEPPAIVQDFDYTQAQGIWTLNSTVQFNKKPLSTPANPFTTLFNTGGQGLAGKFFNGSWRSTISTGNIGTLPLTTTNDSSNVANSTNFPSANHRYGVNLWPYITIGAPGGSYNDNYGFIAIGYFFPPTTGTYTFKTNSDDGSGVWVGELASAASGRTSSNAVLNNGLGLGQGSTTRSGTITLTGGEAYAIRIVMEEASGGDNLTFWWSGPGLSETTDLTQYYRAPTSGGVLTGNFLT